MEIRISVHEIYKLNNSYSFKTLHLQFSFEPFSDFETYLEIFVVMSASSININAVRDSLK